MRILDDIRFTLRGLRNKTSFLLIVLATLAASMGASTAMFTIVNAFFLSSLPYEDADRLVMIWSTPRCDSLSERAARASLGSRCSRASCSRWRAVFSPCPSPMRRFAWSQS